MRWVRRLVRSKGFLIVCIIAAWAGVEVGGKGTGIIHWLFAPAPTREQGVHPLDIFGARPKGPVRLIEAEAKAVEVRLAKAFNGAVPAHRRTSAMSQYYRVKADARCARDKIDLAECNKVEHMEAFFAAVLGAMHPATEHLLWQEVKSYEQGPDRGQLVRVAIFLGSDGRGRLAFDLRRSMRSAKLATFTIRTFPHGDDLKWSDAGDGILIVEDPGPLPVARGFATSIAIFGGTNPPDNRIMALLVEGDVAARHRFLSAVLGAPVQGVEATAQGPAYSAELEPQAETLLRLSGVRVRQALLDTFGDRAARARFSQVKAKSGRGNFYGVVMDGQRYLAVSITDPAHLRQYEFFWDGPGGLKPVSDLSQFAESESRKREGGIQPHYLIPVAEAGSAERLVVFRRGERGAPIAALWPLAKWLAAMEAVLPSGNDGG